MRRTAMKPSRGTVIPHEMRLRVIYRDGGCVGYGLFRGVGPDDCAGAMELDHVRASGGMGMKSVTCDCNLVALCGACHRWKTENGRTARPILLDYLSRFGYVHGSDHAEVTA
jgi:5-methylcytosine-specific restriction endonuclease McrA